MGAAPRAAVLVVRKRNKGLNQIGKNKVSILVAFPVILTAGGHTQWHEKKEKEERKRARLTSGYSVGFHLLFSMGTKRVSMASM